MIALRLLSTFLLPDSSKRSIINRTRSDRIGLESLEPRLTFTASMEALASEFVYELNRVRLLPEDYVAVMGPAWISNKPAPPLVVNPQLVEASEDHANAMATYNFFAHTDPVSGESPNERLRSQGYSLPNQYPDDANGVEVIAASQSSESSIDLLARLLNSSSDFTSNQRNLLLSLGDEFKSNKEIGVGIAALDSTSVDAVWAIEIAHSASTDRFLGGFVFSDENSNGRYEAGEGIPNVVVSSGSLTTTTDQSGAYRLPINAGLHRLRFRTPVGTIAEKLVAVRTDNVQVDWATSSQPQINFRQRSLWTNTLQHLDANSDGAIRPIDALVVINHLNRNGIGPLSTIPPETPWNAIDINGDGTASPTDALLIINYLNQIDT